MVTASSEAVTPARQRRALWIEVGEETRWSFTRPWSWLGGVVLNLVLSLGYLVLVPLTGHHRRAWVVLVGTYFVNFILADVTTTNIFGPDPIRTRDRLGQGESIRRLLIVKNLTLMLIVGLPVLTLTAVLTENDSTHSLLVTLPLVAFPVFCWLAFGDIVSVVLAVKARSIRSRWRKRHDRVITGRWAAHLAVPYALFFLIELVRLLPRGIDAGLPHTLARTPLVHGLLLITLGLAIWIAGVLVASTLVTRRGLHLS
jgi:hypothetical protein